MSSLKPGSAASTRERPLILIVEDDDDAWFTAGALLMRAGYDVRRTASGLEALRLVAELSPDLVLLDLGLPDVDGGQVAATLKAEPATARIPLIIWSAHALLENVEDAERVGADGFIAKPCHLPDVVAEINRWLQPDISRPQHDLMSRISRFRHPSVALPTE